MEDRRHIIMTMAKAIGKSKGGNTLQNKAHSLAVNFLEEGKLES